MPPISERWAARRGDEAGGTDPGTAALVVLAVLGSVAALYLLRAILVPITLAVVLACVLSPVLNLVRRVLRVRATGAAVILSLIALMFGLYLASLTAESLVQAATSLPDDLMRLTGQLSRALNDLSRNHPQLRVLLPESATIDKLGDRQSALLYERLSVGIADLSGWVAQGFIVLVLVLFLLAESEMLLPRVVRFFARSEQDESSEQTLKNLTWQIRSFLLARTVINLVLGMSFATFLWAYGVRFPFALGLFAGLTNFVPYVGQALGGGLPALVALAQRESIGDALIVGSVFLGLVTIEGYVVTPYVLGRSLDLNGTVILIACLFWGFLWGLVGLILAMPITACVKIVCQSDPRLHRWAHLMSQHWEPPTEEFGVGGGPTNGARGIEKIKVRDELYDLAVETVIREGRGSTSLLQRALGIGYGRAGKLIEFMEQDGIVGSLNRQTQTREVLLTLEQWKQLKDRGREGTDQDR